MKDFDYEEEMRALAAFFNGEKSDMSDFVNPYGGNHIPSDALLRNTRKRKGRFLTTSPPANGVCILSTPESVTVSMVA